VLLQVGTERQVQKVAEQNGVWLRLLLLKHTVLLSLQQPVLMAA
jgi:hypothetical protein